MQAAMSCETLVCMGSQTAIRHKPNKYSCDGKQVIQRTNPCPPQGSHNNNNLAQTSRANACKGRQATGWSLPAVSFTQMTTRYKPKVNIIDSSSNRDSLK